MYLLLVLTALCYTVATVTRVMHKVAMGWGRQPEDSGLWPSRVGLAAGPGSQAGEGGRGGPGSGAPGSGSAGVPARLPAGAGGHRTPRLTWFRGPFAPVLVAGPIGVGLAAHLGAGALLLMGGAAPEHFSSRAAFLLAAGVLALVCAALEWRAGETFFSIFGLPLAGILVGFAGLSESVWQNPLFERPWFLAHVAAAVAGECFFLMAAVSATTYLFMVRRLKSKNRLRALQVFPPLAQLDRFTVLFLQSGVAAFGVGIAFGAWGWVGAFGLSGLLGPKKILSAASFVFFAALLAARSRHVLVGPRWSMLTIAGFVGSLSVLLVDRGTHWLAP